MTESVRVIGIGHPAAGDDGVGLVVARALRGGSLPPHVSVHEVTDPAGLVELLTDTDHAILIDAMNTPETPGRIVCTTPDAIANERVSLMSSHGTTVAQALALARTLSPNTIARAIDIIGVGIIPPEQPALELTAAVARAVPDAVAAVHRMLDNGHA